jgi:hypothetical protein
VEVRLTGAVRVIEEDRVDVIVLVAVFVAMGDAVVVRVICDDIVAVTLCVEVLLPVGVLLDEEVELPVRDPVEELDTMAETEEVREAELLRVPDDVIEEVLEGKGVALVERVPVALFEGVVLDVAVREAVVVREPVLVRVEDRVEEDVPVAADDAVFVALAFEDIDAVRVGWLDRDGLDDIVELRVEVALSVGLAAAAANSRAAGSWREESPVQSKG